MKLKLRPDLEIIKRAMRLEEYWIVKDPVSFNHFLFSGQEIQLLKLFRRSANRRRHSTGLAGRISDHDSLVGTSAGLWQPVD